MFVKLFRGSLLLPLYLYSFHQERQGSAETPRPLHLSPRLKTIFKINRLKEVLDIHLEALAVAAMEAPVAEEVVVEEAAAK